MILSARLHNRAEKRDRRQRRESDPHGTLPSLGKPPNHRTPAIPPDGQTHRLRPRSADYRERLHDVADIRVVRPRRELRSHDHGVSTRRPLADSAESVTPTGSRAGFRRLGSRLEPSDDGVPVHTPPADRDAQRDPVGGAILPRPASGNVPRWPVKRPATQAKAQPSRRGCEKRSCAQQPARAGSGRHPKGRISPKTATRRRATESRCGTQRGSDARHVGNPFFLNSLPATPQKRGFSRTDRPRGNQPGRNAGGG